MLDLCILGTGGTMPLADRGLSSLYLRLQGKALLVDSGEGTQVAIRRLGWGFRNIDGLFLTHFHGDHCTGLPGLLLTLTKAQRSEPFHIWGGPGLHQVVNGLCVVVPPPPFPLILHESAEPEYHFTCAGLSCTAFRLDHSVPCWGLRVVIPRKPRFLPEKAQQLAIPKQLWRSLQQGEAVTMDGRTVMPQQVQGAARAGIHLVYATDTRPVPAISAMGHNADLMILEGMYADPEKRSLALRNKHMMFSEAAALAKEAGARRLLLTHFSTSLDCPRDGLAEAQRIFPDTDTADDLMTLTLSYPSAQQGEE